MDEPGLREQFLGRGFVIRLGGRREERIDEDALAVAVATTWMNRQTLEAQEDLDVALGNLDAASCVDGCAGRCSNLLRCTHNSAGATWRPSSPHIPDLRWAAAWG